uniref:C4-dicarboxylate ABC transporter n=1 Tax=Candidatus Methanosuratincola petrocarbonis (ex Vanwonterghem et al. 2016) TaxID=1867261 RepID=A0A7J3UYG6_9CREN
MYIHAGIVLGVMVFVFVVARVLRLSTELSMFAAALIGLIVHGISIPPREILGSTFNWFEVPRHILDGAFTYFDVVLIFLTATLFMNLLKEAGGIVYIVRGIVRRFHRHRTLALLLLTLVMLIPGALTGSGTVTVLVVGSLVGTVLKYMGVSDVRVAAIIFMCAAMSAAAPPINLWAMMSAAGSNMPYVGFFLPLGVLSLLGALFTMFYLGWRGTALDLDRVMAELPKPPVGMSWWKVALPFGVLFALILAGRIWPWSMPVLGLPLIFVIAAAIVVLLNPGKLHVLQVASDTVDQLLPLIGVMVVVGVLVQIMALSGARGLISLGIVTMPLTVLFATLFIILPFSEGLIQYAVAPLIGVPLVLLFNMKGFNPIIALAGMAVMWPIGDMLPPTTVVGRATVMVLGFKGSYYRDFVKTCLVPSAFILLLGSLCIVFSNKLGFLVGG